MKFKLKLKHSVELIRDNKQIYKAASITDNVIDNNYVNICNYGTST